MIAEDSVLLREGIARLLIESGWTWRPRASWPTS